MELECKFSVVSTSHIYTCVFKNASILTPDCEIVGVKGTPVEGYTNEDVAWVEFYPDSKVHYFPKNLHKIFPNMSSLMINGCGLRQIRKQDLVGLERLEDLTIPHNYITRLNDDLFENMTNLVSVNFRNNRIEYASSKVLQPIIAKIEKFNIRDNPVLDDYYIKGSSYGCSTLKILMNKIDEKCQPALTVNGISVGVQTE